MASSSFSLWGSSSLGFPLLFVFLTPPDLDVDVSLTGVLGVLFGVFGALGVLGPPSLLKYSVSLLTFPY